MVESAEFSVLEKMETSCCFVNICNQFKIQKKKIQVEFTQHEIKLI